MHAPGLLAIFLILLMPTQVLSWTSENRHKVNPVSGSVFEVVGRSGSDSMAFWCAAGDYARRVLDVGPTQRIYVVRARGPAVTRARKSAVHFSLSAPVGADLRPWFLLTVSRTGYNMSAAVAQNYCYDRKHFR